MRCHWIGFSGIFHLNCFRAIPNTTAHPYIYTYTWHVHNARVRMFNDIMTACSVKQMAIIRRTVTTLKLLDNTRNDDNYDNGKQQGGRWLKVKTRILKEMVKEDGAITYNTISYVDGLPLHYNHSYLYHYYCWLPPMQRRCCCRRSLRQRIRGNFALRQQLRQDHQQIRTKSQKTKDQKTQRPSDRAVRRPTEKPNRQVNGQLTTNHSS